MQIELIIIGNEILSGDTRDTNGSWLSKYLETLGTQLDQISIIPDQRKCILSTLSQATHRSLLIIISGGQGFFGDIIISGA